MLDQHGEAAYKLSDSEAANLQKQKRSNLLAQQEIASTEGMDAQAAANFWGGAEKAALVTRNVATGALVVVGTVATGGASHAASGHGRPSASGWIISQSHSAFARQVG
jgi:hypothetical protein